MILVQTVKQLKEEIQKIKQQNKRIGFVPTMGYLHEGHGSLITKAREECDFVILSIFVNPMQFGPNEDFERYPRDLERDANFAMEYGVDLIFHPTVEEIYPTYPSLTKVHVAEITEGLCGASRPGHFDGVTTVVLKLFNLVSPERTYFGLKDAQQVAVIQQMVRDLLVPVEIIPCPTVREADGLAKSSRNTYLNKEEREQALILFQSLQMANELIKQGEDRPDKVKEEIRKMIETKPLAEIDYIEILSFPELSEVPTIAAQPTLIALAVKFGSTRLIDNLLIGG